MATEDSLKEQNRTNIYKNIRTFNSVPYFYVYRFSGRNCFSNLLS